MNYNCSIEQGYMRDLKVEINGQKPLTEDEALSTAGDVRFGGQNPFVAAVGEKRQRPLTLISAPAGYGKSVLASMWLQDNGCSYGWVSLDESDNDPPIFIAYLLAARMHIAPSTFRSLLSHAYRQLGAHSRMAAVEEARHLGWIA